ATSCSIALASAIPASFSYQTTNPTTNMVTGTVDTPVDIPSGGLQTFVMILTPTAPIVSTDVAFTFDCTNTPPASSYTGVNTLLLSASAAPVPDVVAIAVAPPFGGPPGVLALNAVTHQGAFAVSAVNVGAGDSITVTADTGAANLPLTMTIC